MYRTVVTEVPEGFHLSIRNSRGAEEYSVTRRSLPAIQRAIIAWTYGRTGPLPVGRPHHGEVEYSSNYYSDEIGQYVTII